MTDERLNLKRMTIGDILDYSIEVYRKNFKKLTLLTLIMYMPFSVLYTFVISYFSGDLLEKTGLYSLTPGDDMVAVDPSGFIYTMLAFYVSMAVMGILYSVYNITLKPVLDAAIARIIYVGVVNGREYSWKEAVKEGFKRFVNLLLNQLLYQLIRFGATVAAVIVLYIAMFILMFTIIGAAAAGGSPSVALMVIIGIIFIVLFAATGLLIAYVSVKFGFGIQAVAIESKSGISGLSRSNRLTAGGFWHAAFASLFGYLLVYFVPTILAGGAYFTVFFNKSLYLALTNGMQIVSSLIYPFTVVLTTMIYINLRIRKEGLDLEARVDMLLEAAQRKDAGLINNNDD